jgi:hypothetical protein
LQFFLQGIMAGMKQFDDEGAQLSSLSELCELLSISTEESLTTFPIEQVVPLLVSTCSSSSSSSSSCPAVASVMAVLHTTSYSASAVQFTSEHQPSHGLSDMSMQDQQQLFGCTRYCRHSSLVPVTCLLASFWLWIGVA